MLRIITDFDGPIMDVSERYYHVYRHCLLEASEPGQVVTLLPKEEFWRLKRAQVPERQIGQISGLYDDQARRFAHLRRLMVHNLPYLVYDQLVPGALSALKRIQSLSIHLVVMTMRRASELEIVMADHHLDEFFPLADRYCLSDTYDKTQDIYDKPLLMQRALAEMPPAAQTWMIGDTEADIIAAQTHQIPVVAVLSGIRDLERLAQHQPTQIVPTLGEAVDYILSQVSLMEAGQ